jgi:hypothetical protein
VLLLVEDHVEYYFSTLRAGRGSTTNHPTAKQVKASVGKYTQRLVSAEALQFNKVSALKTGAQPRHEQLASGSTNAATVAQLRASLHRRRKLPDDVSEAWPVHVEAQGEASHAAEVEAPTAGPPLSIYSTIASNVAIIISNVPGERGQQLSSALTRCQQPASGLGDVPQLRLFIRAVVRTITNATQFTRKGSPDTAVNAKGQAFKARLTESYRQWLPKVVEYQHRMEMHANTLDEHVTQN